METFLAGTFMLLSLQYIFCGRDACLYRKSGDRYADGRLGPTLNWPASLAGRSDCSAGNRPVAFSWWQSFMVAIAASAMTSTVHSLLPELLPIMKLNKSVDALLGDIRRGTSKMQMTAMQRLPC
jgi:hypothetical protein